jgi:DNA-binding transcriptional ArsR family regulator
MSEAVAAALAALGDPTRRDIFERILARPSRILFLADNVAVSRPAVSHHVRVLKEAGLVREDQGLLIATTDVLPAIRVYFDRLWFEASVGEGWMRERFAVSRRMHWRGAEIGLPSEARTDLSRSA